MAASGHNNPRTVTSKPARPRAHPCRPARRLSLRNVNRLICPQPAMLPLEPLPGKSPHVQHLHAPARQTRSRPRRHNRMIWPGHEQQGRDDQSWIVASIVSRPGKVCSHLVCGTGVHKTFHEANIFRGKRRHSVAFAAYIRIWRAGGMVGGRVAGLCLLRSARLRDTLAGQFHQHGCCCGCRRDGTDDVTGTAGAAPIRMLAADDQHVVREGLALLLSLLPSLPTRAAVPRPPATCA
jgi:hypothetical protein